MKFICCMPDWWLDQQNYCNHGVFMIGEDSFLFQIDPVYLFSHWRWFGLLDPIWMQSCPQSLKNELNAKTILFKLPKPFTATSLLSLFFLSFNNTTTPPLLFCVRKCFSNCSWCVPSSVPSPLLSPHVRPPQLSVTISQKSSEFETNIKTKTHSPQQQQGKFLQTVVGFPIVSPTSLVQSFMLEPMTSSTSMQEIGQSFRRSIFMANLFPLWERVQGPQLSIVLVEQNGTFIILLIMFKESPLLVVMVSKLFPTLFTLPPYPRSARSQLSLGAKIVFFFKNCMWNKEVFLFKMWWWTAPNMALEQSTPQSKCDHSPFKV